MSLTDKIAPSKEKVALHYARILACLGVIALHITGFRPENYFSGHLAEWWTRNLVNCFSIWAVPVFVMISGALLLNKNKKENNITFFKKRLLNVGLPALFWIPLFYIFYQFPGQNVFSLQHLADILIRGNVGHLYYLFLILELYLLTPLFRLLLRRLPPRKYLIIALIFVFVDIIWRAIPLTPTFFIGYTGYYLLGPILINIPKKSWPIRISPATFLITSISMSLLVFIATILNIFNQKEILYRSNNPLIIVLSISAFISIYNSRLMKSLTQKISLPILRKISAATFGIYILHPLIIKYLLEFLVWLGLSSLKTFIPWYICLLLIPAVFAITLAVTLLLKSVRYLSALI